MQTSQKTQKKRAPHCIVRVGPMESGKSAAALKYAQRYASIENILFVTSTKDSRANGNVIESRSGCKVPAIKVEKLSQVFRPSVDPERNNYPLYQQASAIVVDEAQFFDGKDLIMFVRACLDNGKDILVAGLDSDANQEPFLPLAELVILATDFKKLHGVCKLCADGTPSAHTIDRQKSAGKNNLRIGNADYIPVCYNHMREHQKEKDPQ